MKNLHLLPTDKPSRLGNVHGKLSFFKDRKWDNTENWRCKNIYITSEEQIKEGDWFCDEEEGEILKAGKNVDLHLINNLKPSYRKIILTTDPDLIKDGVQAIDDKFLEWFVKNPSCEEVEVSEYFKPSNMVYGHNTEPYRIIIPQEEPKDVLLGYKTSLDAQMLDKIGLEEPKQETLEEAAERLFPSKMSDYEIFLLGAKWQAERMYSEEDMRKAFEAGELSKEDDINGDGETLFDEWFEQHKKK